uniref:Fibroblast growth factor n=1 Tax=Ciona savignyi TaxID=51511 RepID=H2ZN91_CIOSA
MRPKITCENLYATICRFLLCVIIFGDETNAISNKRIEDYITMALSRSQTTASTRRYYEIYAKATSSRVQILGKRVNAKGVRGNKYSKMAILSTSFGGRIMIQGVETGRVLCMNRKGRLVGKVLRRAKHDLKCQFNDLMMPNLFDYFTNVAHPKWYVAFNSHGRPKKGPTTKLGQVETMFLKRPIETFGYPSGAPVTDDSRFGEIARAMIKQIRGHPRRKHSRAFTGSNRLMRDSPSAGEVMFPDANSPSLPPDVEAEMARRRSVLSDVQRQLSLDVTIPAHAPTVSATGPPDWSTRVQVRYRGQRKRNKRKRKNKKLRKVRKKPMPTVPTNVMDTDFDIQATTRPHLPTARPFAGLVRNVSGLPTFPSAVRTTESRHAGRRHGTKKRNKKRKSSLRKRGRRRRTRMRNRNSVNT